ncbi:MAG TPA: response regulator [Anaeromyxobacteraceae bacterium]
MDVAAALVQEGVLAPELVARALAEARDGDVASAALRLGLADEASLVRGLARARECPGVDLSRSVVATANFEVMAPDFCLERKVLPVSVGKLEIVLAMVDPDDLELADEVRFITRRKVLRYAAVPVALERALRSAIRAREERRPAWRGAAAPTLPDPGGSWAAVVKPGERALPAVEVPEADEKMELIAAAEMMTPFQAATPPPPPPRPRAPPPAPPKAAESPTLRIEGYAAGKVVLVADDDPEVRKLVVAVVGKQGCVVLEAANGREALDLAREARPDLVLLDAMMPGMHGFEVCRAIKTDREMRGIRVVLCSAVYRGTVGGDAQVAFGADAFLEKPFRIDELTRVVKLGLLGPAAETPEERAARSEAERSWRAAAQALAEGRDAEAATLARAAATRDPRSAEAHYYLGHALTRLGQLYEAVAAYERSTELRPDVDAAHQCLAQSYERLGFQKSAREAWARAVEACKDPQRKKTMQARLLSLLGVS